MKNTIKNLLEVEGNYFSTYAFVQQNNLESTATQVLGNGWEAEDDCNQIQLIIDSLGIVCFIFDHDKIYIRRIVPTV